MKRVLVVGAGAREHALCRALASPEVEVLAAPGNAGIAEVATTYDVRADDVAALTELAVRERVDLVVVGPEAPLVRGLVDRLHERGIAAFGPSASAARLEGSKCFMKSFLKRHHIPTADFELFENADAADAYVRAAARPLVVKADGLAAGKGVVVAQTTDEALAAVRSMMRERAFGDAGARVVIEELLPGEEASFHVVCDGERAVPLAPAQDHKRIFDGDRGPNTGGMGAYAPAPIVTREVHERVMREVVEPTLRGMKEEGAEFRGVLFVGLMIDEGVPRVLEFNVRFGDPETSVLVPTYGGSWLALLDGAARGRIPDAAMDSTPTCAALSVVMAASGYPGTPRTGDVIHGLGASLGAGCTVLHAGTRRDEAGAIVTAGGRVLNVVGSSATLTDARDLAYRGVDAISFAGSQARRDIGARALSRAGKPR